MLTELATTNAVTMEAMDVAYIFEGVYKGALDAEMLDDYF